MMDILAVVGQTSALVVVLILDYTPTAGKLALKLWVSEHRRVINYLII